MDKIHFSDVGRPPELLAVQEAVPQEGEAGKYLVGLPAMVEGEFTLLVECNAREFPFETYCRFVRHAGEDHPYTFSSMAFHESPPGIRLGPWPGWRGIPEFPIISALSGTVEIRLQPTFWGDEIGCGILRVFGRFPDRASGAVIINSTDRRIVPIRVFIYRTRALRAQKHYAELLPELSGVHPRLLIRPEELPLLRSRVSSTHRLYWSKLVTLWENRYLPFLRTPEAKCVAGPERLSGEDQVIISAFLALMTEKNGDIQPALNAYTRYLEETGRPDFEPLGIDTQAGEVLFTLCVGYDWLFAWMSEDERVDAWLHIERVAGICSSYLGPERRDYGQAHYLGCGLGLLAYSFLLSDVRADGHNWTSELRGALDCALALLSSDGSYPHGINLWIYEFGFLLRWIELFRGCARDNLWLSIGWALGRASAFRAATLSSNASVGVTFGDAQYRVGGDSWCHFLIASRTGSGLAQWLGERLLDLPHEGVDFRSIPARRRVYEILFFNPEVTATPPGRGVQTFSEIGQVTARSKDTLFTMRSGPPLGRRRYSAGEYGAYGHSDPASGSFLIEHEGRFIASGPGPVYRRDTALHNVVTLDGQGQVGDSTVWLPDFFPPEIVPPIPHVAPESLHASLTADLTRAYLPHLGVERYTRAIYVDPARVVLGVDTLSCTSVHSVEWNVHSRIPFSLTSPENPLVFDLGQDVRLIVFTPLNALWTTGLSEFVPAYPNEGVRDYRCVVSTHACEAQFVWCYLLAAQTLPQLRRGEKGRLTVELGAGLLLDFDGLSLSQQGKQ